MKNLVFLDDSIINKELAFVLNVPFKKVDINKVNKENLIYASRKSEKKRLESKGLKYKIDYIDFDYLCEYLDNYNRPNEVEARNKFERNMDKINLIPLEKLSLSEMLIKVLNSNPKDIDCKEIDGQAYIDDYGNIWGCCPGWVSKSFGNLLLDKDPYNNYYSRIIKLSSINKSFCFCNLSKCKYFNSKEANKKDLKYNFKVNKIPKHIIIATDKTCNLRCNSCRKSFFIATKEEKERSRLITQKILDTTWLDKSPFMIAGQGEVFYSKEYLNLIKTDKHRKHVDILSNGNLFDEEKWKLIEDKYDEISVSISIDAATKKTYTKLRHGNFDILMSNIKMLGKKRKEGKFKYYSFNYVVQKDNMNEIIDFIKLGKENNVDYIQFTKLNNWGTMSDEEYKDASLIIDDYLNYDLYIIFTNPIFNDKTIDISCFTPYIEKSKKVYE